MRLADHLLGVEVEEVSVGGVGVMWNICSNVSVSIVCKAERPVEATTDLYDSSPMASEDKLTLTPLVAHTLVDGHSRNTIRIFFTIAYVFVQ